MYLCGAKLSNLYQTNKLINIKINDVRYFN